MVGYILGITLFSYQHANFFFLKRQYICSCNSFFFNSFCASSFFSKVTWTHMYNLGLGDRHSQNILLDTNSGEIVHIDLGVAFDQGLALPTPELVPFRLTRDIVDAMGITGTEGVFRRCCEETLKVFFFLGILARVELIPCLTLVNINQCNYKYQLHFCRIFIYLTYTPSTRNRYT